MPGVGHTVTIAGQSFLLNANGSNFGSMFVMLEPFEDRRHEREWRRRDRRQAPRPLVREIAGRPGRRLRRPAGRRPGQRRRLQAAWSRTAATRASPNCKSRPKPGRRRATPSRGWSACSPCSAPTRRNSTSTSTAPSARRWAWPLSDVFNTLQVYLGGYYVNDFNEFGRTWQVNIQADNRFRDRAEDVASLKVRNAQGDMVPLGTLADVRDSTGPVLLNRYNTHTAAAINGDVGPGDQFGPGHRPDAETGRRELPPAWLRMDRADLPGRCWPATRRCSSSRCACCWSS